MRDLIKAFYQCKFMKLITVVREYPYLQEIYTKVFNCKAP